MRPFPILVDNLLDKNTFKKLKQEMLDFNFTESYRYQAKKSRYNYMSEFLIDTHKKLLPKAREIFKSDTLLPSFPLYMKYMQLVQSHENIFDVPPHYDQDACTYVLNLCLHQSEDWKLWVEHLPYTVKENQALAYYGEEQIHWREKVKSPDSVIGIVTFNFVEPDHWYFTKHPEFGNVLLGYMTEEEFYNKYKIK